MKSLFSTKPGPGRFDSEIEAARFTISKMTLEPGDIIILRHPRQITCEAADRLIKSWKEAFPGWKCLVLEDGMDIGILNKAEIERQLGDETTSSREVA